MGLLWKAFESAQVTKRMFQRKSLWEAYPARIMRGGQRLRNPRKNWKLRNTLRVQNELVPYIIRLRKTIIERSDKFDEEYAHYDEPTTTEACPRDAKLTAKLKKKTKTDEQTPKEKGKPNLEGKTPSKPAEACPSEEARTTDAISQPSDAEQKNEPKEKNKTNEQKPIETGKPSFEAKLPNKAAEACPSVKAKTTEATGQPSDVEQEIEKEWQQVSHKKTKKDQEAGKRTNMRVFYFGQPSITTAAACPAAKPIPGGIGQYLAQNRAPTSFGSYEDLIQCTKTATCRGKGKGQSNLQMQKTNQAETGALRPEKPGNDMMLLVDNTETAASTEKKIPMLKQKPVDA